MKLLSLSNPKWGFSLVRDDLDGESIVIVYKDFVVDTGSCWRIGLREVRALHRWLGAWIREQERRKGRKRK